MNDPAKFLSEIDSLIRTGQARKARALMLACKPFEIPRVAKVEFARLARRMHISHFALRILNPVVRPTGRKVGEATDAEKSEYAAALTSVGALGESIEIFQSLDAARTPDVLLLESFAHFAQWNYAKAIPLLERYTTTPGLADYWRLVGLANLASALVYERSPKATPILEELLRLAGPKQFTIVYGYALKLLAEQAVWEKRWSAARKQLTVAADFFKDTDSLEALFIKKWVAIVNLYERPVKASTKAFNGIVEEAQKRAHWETLRSSDYHIAVATQNERLLHHFIFGTPHESLNQKLISDFGGGIEMPQFYKWEIGSGAQRARHFSLSERSKENPLKEGGNLHRLLSVLCTDFYRPFRTAEIHARIFPGDYYNPLSSPHRIAQLVNRLRLEWKASDSSLLIVEKKGAYRLTSKVPCHVQLERQRELSDTPHFRLEQLLQKFSNEPFGVQEAMRALSLPLWTCKRLIKQALAEGMLVRQGSGNRVQYRFLPAAPAVLRKSR